MKRFLALFLTIILLTSALPLAINATEDSVFIGGIELKNGKYLTNGANEPTDVLPTDTGYAYYENGVLTLNCFSYEGIGLVESDEHSLIYAYSELIIQLIGENSIVSDIEAAPSYHYWIGIDSISDLMIVGEGSLYIYGDYGICVNNKEGDTIFIFDEATLNIKTRETAIDVLATKAKCDAYACFLGGEVNIDSATNGIEVHGNMSTYLYVSGGEINVSAEESVHIYSQYEQYLYIDGGKLNVTSGNVSVVAIFGNFEDSHIIVTAGELICWSLGDTVMLGDRIEVVELGNGRVSYREKEFELGDVNADSTIDQYDYILICRHYFKTRLLTEEELSLADVNSDSKVDQFDYILVKRIYFGTYTVK